MRKNDIIISRCIKNHMVSIKNSWHTNLIVILPSYVYTILIRERSTKYVSVEPVLTQKKKVDFVL